MNMYLMIFGLVSTVLITLGLWHARSLSGVRQQLALLQGGVSQQAQTVEAVARRVEERAEQMRELDSTLRVMQVETAANITQALVERSAMLQQHVGEALTQGREMQQRAATEFRDHVLAMLTQHRESFERRQTEVAHLTHETLQTNLQALREQLSVSLQQHAQSLGAKVAELTEKTEFKLAEISGQVDKRLAEGFEKTTATFTDIVKRLALIDEAQKKITELSNNVVSLQDVLADKRSRGAFGEVQLAALVRNVIPESNFRFQHVLSNNTRVDCLLLMPGPNANVAIDAKFPLEAYRRLADSLLSDAERRAAERQFKIDIKKHVDDIAQKYILPGETADGAVMFIPAEAVFAEIHARHADLVDYAQQARVWLVSPTTMMAVLTTARAVLKDDATRQQIHVMKEHLVALARDFGRFEERIDKLATHIDQAHRDIKDVHVSARKLTSRFQKIERADFAVAQTDSHQALATSADV
jgi:DNA recombination protein RmuC